MGVEERDESRSGDGGPESGGPGGSDGARPPRQVPNQGGPLSGPGSGAFGGPMAVPGQVGADSASDASEARGLSGGTVLPGPWGPMDGIGDPGTACRRSARAGCARAWPWSSPRRGSPTPT